MVFDEIVERMKRKPYLLGMGSGKLSRYLKCSVDDIRRAKDAVRSSDYHSAVVGPPKKMPKVLIFDTETAPMLGYIWGLWKQDIAWDHVRQDWFMLCWSAKWLYGGEVMCDVLTSEEALWQDDSRIMRSLWKLIDEADVVVAHNAKRADVPWMNTRFILNDLKCPSPYYIIDTLDVAKRYFGFKSNKLDALAGYFGFPHKIGTDFSLWEKCLKGDGKALEEMSVYNQQDVKILELVYLKLRPWMKSHPNVAATFDDGVVRCPVCGSSEDHLVEIPDRYYNTSTCRYKLYRCIDCGAVVRGRENLNKDNKKVVPLTSPAR